MDAIRLVELRAIFAYDQWRAFMDRRRQGAGDLRAQLNYWRERWVFNVGRLKGTTH